MPVALITGSDSGIGRASAVALARDGFDVGVTFRSDEQGAHGTAAEVEAVRVDELLAVARAAPEVRLEDRVAAGELQRRDLVGA